MKSCHLWQHGITLNVVSQIEQGKYCMISPVCETYKENKKLIDTKNSLVVATGRGEE